MPHERQTIREAAKTLLEAATIVAAGRVVETRLAPYASPAQLPAIGIYTNDDSVDTDTVERSPRNMRCVTELVIEAVATYADDIEDQLDDLALAIETALEPDRYLGLELVNDSFLVSTETLVTGPGAKAIGMCRLVYNVIWFRYSRAQATATDDFNTIHVTNNLAGEQTDDRDRVKQIIDLEEE